jgi:uncharacterized membrane protein
MSRWRLRLARLLKQSWVLSAAYGLAGIAAALLAAEFQGLVPEDFAYRVGADAAGNVLGILASSMLSVTTFSLTILVSALASASSGASPRATALVVEDSTTRNALATFIGAFMFSIVGIIALATGLYGRGGRLLLLAATVAVIAIIIVTLLRWMQHLSRMGRVGETVDRIEAAALIATRARLAAPLLGGAPRAPGQRQPVPLYPKLIGYVQHIDMARLQAALPESTLDVEALPGRFVHPASPLAWVPAGLEPTVTDRLRDAFLVAEDRSFEQDPRFGLVVLGETAAKALSAAINDSGTVIDVVHTITRVLAAWAEAPPEPPGTPYPSIRVPALDPDDLLDDAFGPVARLGANSVEIGIHLQKALAALAAIAPAEFAIPARRQSALALARARQELALPADYARVATAARWRSAPPG